MDFFRLFWMSFFVVVVVFVLLVGPGWCCFGAHTPNGIIIFCENAPVWAWEPCYAPTTHAYVKLIKWTGQTDVEWILRARARLACVKNLCNGPTLRFHFFSCSHFRRFDNRCVCVAQRIANSCVSPRFIFLFDCRRGFPAFVNATEGAL